MYNERIKWRDRLTDAEESKLNRLRIEMIAVEKEYDAAAAK
jgi:hypothetical protein